MRRPPRYPTLLELMRRGRQATLAGGSALVMLTAGCGVTDGDVGFPQDVLPDGETGPDDAYPMVDLGVADLGAPEAPGDTASGNQELAGRVDLPRASPDESANIDEVNP